MMLLQLFRQTKANGNYKDFEFEIIKNFTMEAPVSESEFQAHRFRH
jgi:preprotein translocase subunit SecA